MAPIPPLPDLLKGLPSYQPQNHYEITEEDSLLDVLQGCIPYLPSESDKPEQLSFQNVTPILQEGPTCGIVAVGMISSLVPRNLAVNELLEDAQALGFTKSGEMFSVDDMAAFIKHVVGDYFSVEVFSNGLAKRKDKIFNDLINAKALYLVPYDADRNNSPACLKGHKAHWALICGAAICQGNFYVLGRQGKSRHMGVWPFEDLDKSNSNLIEICPCRLSMPDKYILHDLQVSMAGKYIKLVEYSVL